MASQYVTTGLFPVPTLPAAVAASVEILLTSFQDAEAPVAWSVNRMQADGGKERVDDGTVHVPGQGMASITLLPRAVEGRVIEVNLMVPSPAIQPTVAVVRSFLVDESRQIALWLSPRDFALRRTARFGKGKAWRLQSRQR